MRGILSLSESDYDFLNCPGQVLQKPDALYRLLYPSDGKVRKPIVYKKNPNLELALPFWSSD